MIFIFPICKLPVWLNKLFLRLIEEKVSYKIIFIDKYKEKNNDFIHEWSRINPKVSIGCLTKDTFFDFLKKIDGTIIVDFINYHKYFDEKIIKKNYVISTQKLKWQRFEIDEILKQWFLGSSHYSLKLFKVNSVKNKEIIGKVVGYGGNISIKKTRDIYFSYIGLIFSRVISLLNEREFFIDNELKLKERKRLFFISFFNIFFTKLKIKLNNPKWSTFIFDYKDISEVNIKLDVKPLDIPKEIELADPFIYSKDNKTFIFAEKIDKNGFGSLVSFSLDNLNEMFEILPTKFHKSYPFLFEYENELYMLPEQSANNKLEIYKCTSFPNDWELYSVIRQNCKYVDSSILFYEGYFWIFANSNEFAASLNEELHILYSESISGPWLSHSMNPIKFNTSLSRPAGSFRIINNCIFRPVQDCSRIYGEKIHWMQILELTPERFNESLVCSIEPNWKRGLLGTHSISFSNVNNLGVIDCLN